MCGGKSSIMCKEEIYEVVIIAIIHSGEGWRRCNSGQRAKHEESNAPGFGILLDLPTIALYYCSYSREIGHLASPEGLFLISVCAELDGAI